VQAMNEYGREKEKVMPPWEVLAEGNETAPVRCIAITFETRPDWCRSPEIARMITLGVTKVELGVQHLDDDILSLNRRGCTVEDAIRANTLLRDAGLKVGFHMMPNLPGSTVAKDRDMFRDLFADPSFRPDFLKIYPTLVTPGSGIERLWERGEYHPYPEEELVDLLAEVKSILPEYVRLQRVQRDIPAKLIVAGSRHSNFRQLVQERIRERGARCHCIRCREVGRCDTEGEPELRELRYSCCGGEEFFLSMESGSSLIGFARLRLPGSTTRLGGEGTALLRELHVYGELVPVGIPPKNSAWQHRRFGEELLSSAEAKAAEEGYSHLQVLSGIGVRPYYRKHGYRRSGSYMEKRLP
jgi:elongator complex protein 3